MDTSTSTGALDGSRTPLKTAAFAITARIALQLGRESISNSIIAIIELVKNAYDADAENVHLYFTHLDDEDPGHREIIIDDDGSGMTLQQLEESWLVIGTNSKQIAPRSRGKRRILTGEKGLGRLGLDRLCARTRLQTFTQDEPAGLELDIAWTKYEGTHDRLESIEHEIYRVPKVVGGAHAAKVKGTRLILSGLKDEWSADDLRQLRNELALLVSPFGGVNDFAIYLHTRQDEGHDDRIASSDLLEAAEWKVEGTLSEVGDLIDIKISSARREAAFHDGPLAWADVFPELHGRPPECGPVRFVFYYLSRKDIPALSLKAAQIGEFLDNNQGIRVYRDGFRVMPYGKPTGEGDWLNLALRRTRSPGAIRKAPVGAWRVGYNQVVGAVFITRDKNAALLDQTNREGIVEGPAYYDLRRFALKCVETFERQLQVYEKAQGPADADDAEVEIAFAAAEESSKASIAVIEQLKDTVASAAQLLESARPGTEPSPDRTKVSELLVEQLDAVARAVTQQQDRQVELVRTVDRREEERQEEFQRQKDTLGNLASLGILATAFGHETEAASNLLLANTGELDHLVQGLFWLPGDMRQQIHESSDRITRAARKIHTFAAFTLRNVTRDKRARNKVFLDKVIRRVFASFERSLEEERKILVSHEFDEDIPPLTAFAIDWESIIINFITNAVWALEGTAAEARRMRVRLSSTPSHLRLAFADSGCGIARGTEHDIFTPTFTTKRNKRGDLTGTGMGLAIVQSFVESYNGSIRVVSSSDLGGAEFIIEVPLKAREAEERTHA